MRDIVTGALDERTSDWYAQDAAGNVWYFGEDTKEYTNGVVSSTAGTWEAGVDGALPGIIMQAQPDAATPTARSTGRRMRRTWPWSSSSAPPPRSRPGRYSNVLVTNDRDLLDTDKDEDKYFAPGVGLVKLERAASTATEKTSWLVSILAPK